MGNLHGIAILGDLSLHLIAWHMEISISHLGHFLLEFFGQIWTKGILGHILGAILIFFEICHFLGGLSLYLIF